VDGAKSLEDYLEDAAVWEKRLAQARRWIERLSGPGEEATPREEGKGGTVAEAETLEERLRRRVEELGYHGVKAEHRIQQSPTFTVTELVAEAVQMSQLPDETLDVVGQHLSTHPALLNETPELEVTSSKNTLGASIRLGQFGVEPGDNTLAMHYHGLPTDSVAGQLKISGDQPIRGGTIDLDAEGTWTTEQGVSVDLPLVATLNQATLALAGMQPTQVEQLAIPISVEGPLDRPRIRVDDAGLATALAQAGVQRAKAELQSRAETELKQHASNQVGEQGTQLLRGILGGKEEDSTDSE
jgi:hypothetical protein